MEWTNQHGCGGNEDSNPQKQNCVLVLQYACQDDVSDPRGKTDSQLMIAPSVCEREREREREKGGGGGQWNAFFVVLFIPVSCNLGMNCSQ